MNVLKPHLQTTIATLLRAGRSQREIERATGIDRKTIRTYQLRFAAEQANSLGVATGSELQIPPPCPPAVAQPSVSACEPHSEFIEAQLRLKRNFMAIYQDLVDQHGFTGAYNSVKRFAGGLRQGAPEQFDRLEFAPAEEAQVDYGEGAPTRVLGSTRYRKPRLFVMTLRYSRRSFRRVVWKSSQQTWARLHEEAWRYFGGACQYVVLDNLKEGVIKPDLYEPELNAVYAATLAHYGVVADPARVRDPSPPAMRDPVRQGGPGGPAQAVGNCRIDPALSAPADRHRVRACHARRGVQLPPHPGTDRPSRRDGRDWFDSPPRGCVFVDAVRLAPPTRRRRVRYWPDRCHPAPRGSLLVQSDRSAATSRRWPSRTNASARRRRTWAPPEAFAANPRSIAAV